MNNQPRQKLCELIVQYGRSLCDDPRRCEALLRDFCGNYRGEISALINAQKEGVASELLKSSNSVPREILLARLTKRLQDDLYMTQEAARWTVESWALALGVIANSDALKPSQDKPERRDEDITTIEAEAVKATQSVPPLPAEVKQKSTPEITPQPSTVQISSQRSPVPVSSTTHQPLPGKRKA